MKKISDKKLAKLGGKLPYSTIASPRKAVRKSNPIATKKRRARNAKRMRGAEYKTARAGAMARSGGRCEFVEQGDRCPETERLQFHELRYPKTRALSMLDGLIYCFAHHMQAEKSKPHKWGKRAFA